MLESPLAFRCWFLQYWNFVQHFAGPSWLATEAKGGEVMKVAKTGAVAPTLQILKHG
jgi:hypothetical protein